MIPLVTFSAVALSLSKLSKLALLFFVPVFNLVREMRESVICCRQYFTNGPSYVVA